MYPRYILSVKRPKLVFHLVVWGERESELVSVRERVSVFSLCGFFPPFLCCRDLPLSPLVISTLLYQLNPFVIHPLFLSCTPSSSFTVRALRSRADCLLIFCSIDCHQWYQSERDNEGSFGVGNNKRPRLVAA